jgi:hypothetical protein
VTPDSVRRRFPRLTNGFKIHVLRTGLRAIETLELTTDIDIDIDSSDLVNHQTRQET